MKQIKFHPEILSTTNYGLFKILEGNRQVIPMHVKRLKRSFQDNGFLLSPILVNQHHEIIDGQNRFSALVELSLPVYYIKVYNYGLEEVKILNANHAKWKNSDYLGSFVESGSLPYVQFKKFQEDFPAFNFTTCVKILSGVRSNKSEQLEGVRGRVKDFEHGEFEIPNLRKSYATANKLMQIKPFFPKFNDNRFIVTMLGMFENVNYDHNEFLKKLKIQPTDRKSVV